MLKPWNLKRHYRTDLNEWMKWMILEHKYQIRIAAHAQFILKFLCWCQNITIRHHDKLALGRSAHHTYTLFMHCIGIKQIVPPSSILQNCLYNAEIVKSSHACEWIHLNTNLHHKGLHFRLIHHRSGQFHRISNALEYNFHLCCTGNDWVNMLLSHLKLKTR